MPYHTHLYQALADQTGLRFTAVFASDEGVRPYTDGFGQPVRWDSSVVEGYDHRFLESASSTPVSGGFFAINRSNIASVLSELRPDIVWLHGYNHFLHQSAAAYCFLRGIPVLMREDQTLLTPRPLWKAAAKHLALRPFLALTTSLYVGTNNKEWFLHYGAPPERLFHMPYSVDNAGFQSQRAELLSRREILRSRFGVTSSEVPVIAAVGRMIPEKQYDLLIRGFGRARQSANCMLLLVGLGDLEGTIRKQVQESGTPDVIFAGFKNRSEIAEVYSAADIFVLASCSETWGLVVNEAMNFGLPLILSDRVGCAVDLCLPGENGFIVPYQDAPALADAILSLVCNMPRRISMGERSRRLIQCWSVNDSVDGLRRAIDSSLDRSLS